MENNLREFLDKIYELEGLVHLAVKREDNSDDLLHLIKRKAQQISEFSKKLNSSIDSMDDIEKDVSIVENLGQSFALDEYSLEEVSEVLPENIVKQESTIVLTPGLEKGKLVFSINDRFRFRKELFRDSDADFNNTLALVASMDSYEEAEEYFISEEGLDINNPAVKDFLEVIKKYFR